MSWYNTSTNYIDISYDYNSFSYSSIKRRPANYINFFNSDFNSDSYILFYNRDDQIYDFYDSYYYNYYIEDDVYALISNELKEHYNFQNYSL